MSVFGLLLSYDFKSIQSANSVFYNKLKQYLVLSIKRVEEGNFFSKTFSIGLPSKYKKEALTHVILFILIGGICFCSRAYFLKFDQYVFSDSWFKSIEYISDLNNQHWLLGNNQAFGAYIFVDFLTNITQQIPETSLFIFNIIVSICLSFILYWTVLKIGNTQKTVALLTALLFAVFYRVLPVNLTSISQISPILLSLLFVVPLMVYLLKPKLFSSNKAFFYVCVFLSFFAIACISVFTYIIIVFPLLVLLLLLSKRKQALSILICLPLYLLVSIILTVVYNLNGIDILLFVKSNIIAVSSYTQTPHLLFPLKILLHGVQFISFITLVVIFLFKKDNSRSISIVLIFYNVLVLINSFKLIWVDTDLLIEVFTVFIPLTLGLSLAVLGRVFKPLFKNRVYYKRYVLPVATLISFFIVSVFFNKNVTQHLDESNQFASRILSVYENISSNYLPYSYAVVNDKKLQSFSKQKHYYLSFEEFNQNYLRKDQLYHAFRVKEDILKKNPELVIPKSILLFIYKDNDVTELGLDSSIETIELSKKKLSSLKERNRDIKLFYENDIFKVIEIINEPKSSKITELMIY
ncbi:hypothetical protein [Pseudofulvibacter geojedonensis]